MRTTIEMKPEHRARLLEMGARRGEKGFSSVVEEAIEAFLQAHAQNDEIRKKALRAGGSLGQKEAEALRRRAAKIRAQWR
ncbi:MAG: hypothetical protein HY238_06775 [Acidobacteria bacterium]|nr:hypothetical protein [Acidobacteriota bacterium]